MRAKLIPLRPAEIRPDTVYVEAPTAKQRYTYEYPRPSVTVDVVVLCVRAGALSVLLVRRGGEPFAGTWALPGGFVEMDEDLETAAVRELAEETGLSDVRVWQLHTFGAPERDPRGRVISVAYLALLGPDQAARSRPRGGSDASEAAWWAVAELPELAFDHAEIIGCALARWRHKSQWTASWLRLLPAECTLAEALEVYEALSDEAVDGDEFRRRMLGEGLLVETGRVRRGCGGAGALYRVTGV